MTLCPIALAVGCRKCPIFSVCPVKGVIGDYKKEEDAPSRAAAPVKAKAGTKSTAKSGVRNSAKAGARNGGKGRAKRAR